MKQLAADKHPEPRFERHDIILGLLMAGEVLGTGRPWLNPADLVLGNRDDSLCEQYQSNDCDRAKQDNRYSFAAAKSCPQIGKDEINT